MANDCAIQPLDVSTFPSPDDTSNPGFTDLFNELVGDAGTPADGYEDDIATANALLDAIDNGLALLGGADGGDLDDTFAEILTVDPQPIADLVAEHAAALPAGDQSETDLGNLIAAVSSPAPPSGGGGGGGGVGAGACVAINLGKVQEFISGTVVNRQGLPLSIQNTTGRTVTVKGVSWSPNDPTHFTVVTPVAGVQIQPGGTFQFSAVAVPFGDGIVSSTLTLETDAPDPQPCWKITMEIVPGAGGGGIGPGGP